MKGTRLPRDEDWIHQAHVDLEGLWETAAFRLHEAYDVAVRPGWRLDLPTQPWGEIWLIRSGACTLSLGDEAAVAGPGELAILRPGRPRMSANEGTEPLSLVGFGFSIMLSEMIDLLTQLRLPLVLREPSDELCSLVSGTVAASNRGSADRVFRARALAQLTLAEIAVATGTELPESVPSAVAGRGAQSAVRPEIRAALDFVAVHFRESLDLTTVARAAHLSPKHLARLFREAVGIPPMAYVRRYRLLQARTMLITSDEPITRIAHDCGFTESAHFSRAFRVQFGVSARVLRDHSRAFRSTGAYA